jgi:hypothetical protein
VKTKTQLEVMLSQLYPHLDWSNLSLFSRRFKEQQYLERVVRALFEVSE